MWYVYLIWYSMMKCGVAIWLNKKDNRSISLNGFGEFDSIWIELNVPFY